MMMLVQVRQRFYNHEDFMLELQSHQGAVRKVIPFFVITIIMIIKSYCQVLDEGRRLAAASGPQQQQDIRIQMKLLSERSLMMIEVTNSELKVFKTPLLTIQHRPFCQAMLDLPCPSEMILI